MTDGSRHLPALVLLVVLAFIQGWAPLLHAHVLNGDVPAIESGTAGIHLPDRLPPVAHRHVPDDPPAVHTECRDGEGALVTAPTEHRRNDRLATTGAAAAPPPPWSPCQARSRSLVAGWTPHPSPTARRADAAPPFPVGPPFTR